MKIIQNMLSFLVDCCAIGVIAGTIMNLITIMENLTIVEVSEVGRFIVFVGSVRIGKLIIDKLK